ncbi:MAG: thioredoxin [Candidatus Pacebacteria bacterium]|nr:thioredoxin [Candidatus Paceibacterota bacterium]
MSDQKGAVHLTDENFAQTIKEAGKPVFVDFYADWCGPCQMAAPIIDDLAEEYRDKIVVAKLNVDQNRQAAGQYGVMSIPTVIVFEAEDGQIKQLEKQIGFPGEAGYRSLIEQVIK